MDELLGENATEEDVGGEEEAAGDIAMPNLMGFDYVATAEAAAAAADEGLLLYPSLPPQPQPQQPQPQQQPQTVPSSLPAPTTAVVAVTLPDGQMAQLSTDQVYLTAFFTWLHLLCPLFSIPSFSFRQPCNLGCLLRVRPWGLLQMPSPPRECAL